MSIRKDIEEWKPEKEEDDNAFFIRYNQTDNKAGSIRQRMMKAGAELSEACFDDPFGKDFSVLYQSSAKHQKKTDS